MRLLPGAAPSAQRTGREALITEAMRPSGKTGRWQQYIATADRRRRRQRSQGVSLIEAPSAQDEAETIALILREAAETPGRTAALVSPDRLLARRVAVRLEAWGIRVDDSAGRPFAKTPPGTFLDLVIAAAAEDFAPAAVMALLKHPLTRLGLDAFAVRRAARALEIAAFRDVYLGRGLDGIAEALARAEEHVAEGRRRQTRRAAPVAGRLARRRRPRRASAGGIRAAARGLRRARRAAVADDRRSARRRRRGAVPAARRRS